MDLSSTEVWEWIWYRSMGMDLVQKYGNGSSAEVWEEIWNRVMGRDLVQNYEKRFS